MDSEHDVSKRFRIQNGKKRLLNSPARHLSRGDGFFYKLKICQVQRSITKRRQTRLIRFPASIGPT